MPPTRHRTTASILFTAALLGTSPSRANDAPVIGNPGPVSVDEEARVTIGVPVSDPDGDPYRVFVRGLPPGAIWDESSQVLTFRPDFIQGGDTWTVAVWATDGTDSSTEAFPLTIRDTISPPAPLVLDVQPQSGWTRYVLEQVTDSWLDSPGYAGRSFPAVVAIPDAASSTNPMKVQIPLHGFGGGSAPGTWGSSGSFVIHAVDPMNSYWWGYSDRLPGTFDGDGDSAGSAAHDSHGPGTGAGAGGTGAGPFGSGTPESIRSHATAAGTVPNYTQRRVLHLLEWTLRNFPGADPARVEVTGGSMGGAGAAELGLLYARHFSYVLATIGQKIPRNHRPSRIAQLSTLWGHPRLSLPSDRPRLSVWDRQDLTRALLREDEARNQFLELEHGKDDPTIHFGAVVMPSPLTGLSFYEVLQSERIGHYAIWDERGHGSPPDPVMGSGWWDNGFIDGFTFLRSDLPFPAFTRCQSDRDPGDGGPNGNQPWDPESGYAGNANVAGDTGWNGDIAGTYNRHLRWNANAIVDREFRLEMPLRAVVQPGGPPPQTGYPSTGDLWQGPLPILVDVTIRRAQRFRCLPGQTVLWTFGSASGAVAAGPDGVVTVPDVPITDAWTTLALVTTLP